MAEETYLNVWEEAVGVLEKIEEDGVVLKCDRRIKLLLAPSKLEKLLRKYVGRRIGLLRTEAGYRVRREDGKK